MEVKLRFPEEEKQLKALQMDPEQRMLREIMDKTESEVRIQSAQLSNLNQQYEQCQLKHKEKMKSLATQLELKREAVNKLEMQSKELTAKLNQIKAQSDLPPTAASQGTQNIMSQTFEIMERQVMPSFSEDKDISELKLKIQNALQERESAEKET